MPPYPRDPTSFWTYFDASSAKFSLHVRDCVYGNCPSSSYTFPAVGGIGIGVGVFFFIILLCVCLRASANNATRAAPPKIRAQPPPPFSAQVLDPPPVYSSVELTTLEPAHKPIGAGRVDRGGLGHGAAGSASAAAVTTI